MMGKAWMEKREQNIRDSKGIRTGKGEKFSYSLERHVSESQSLKIENNIPSASVVVLKEKNGLSSWWLPVAFAAGYFLSNGLNDNDVATTTPPANPLAALERQAKISTLEYDANQTGLSLRSKDILREFAEKAHQVPEGVEYCITGIGYASLPGQNNGELSQRRVEEARFYLTEILGVPTNNLQSAWMGGVGMHHSNANNQIVPWDVKPGKCGDSNAASVQQWFAHL